MVWALMLAFSVVATIRYYWERHHEAMDADTAAGSFGRWLGQGLVAPVIIFPLFNLNLIPGFPALWPSLVGAKTGSAAWWAALSDLTAVTLLVVASYWGAMTFLWLIILLARHPQDHFNYGVTTAIWSILTVPVAALVLHLGGAATAGLAAMCVLAPAAHAQLGSLQHKRTDPSYSRAISLMKMGKFEAAEMEVLEELQDNETNFDGWLMLAQLYAEHFHELTEADQTVRDLCHQPGISPSQFSVALHRLADWHLKIGSDPRAAHDALAEIGLRYPGSHLARMAQMRMDQLPATREELLQQREVRKLRLPSAGPPEPAPAVSFISPEAAARSAARCVEMLRENPDDTSAREEYARCLAELGADIQRALEQLMLLLDMPGQADASRARWLATAATWQLRYRRDDAAARAILESLVTQYPQSREAFQAQQRLNLMTLERKLRRRSRVAG